MPTLVRAPVLGRLTRDSGGGRYLAAEPRGAEDPSNESFPRGTISASFLRIVARAKVRCSACPVRGR
eukprot:5469304-Pyramimonas_sp.AAC.1